MADFNLKLSIFEALFNNYSPKWRWLAVDIRDFTIYDAVIDENATIRRYHWLKEEK